ncbi:MAG TPA: tetratricopeptide repeat protein [Candidatus Acidoferrum sp.]|nr:tetratricopeptide repeat protein [Candidatus Acidoferrum sp.]
MQELKRRYQKPQPGCSNLARPLAIELKTSGPSATRIAPVRLWLFRGLAVIVLPLLALLMLELALRLGGYGYPTGFFRPMRIGNQELVVENDCFGFRFFPPAMARLPASFRFPAKKAPGTYRIFILGESAALGDPEPAFGVGRYLEVLLRERFPHAKFEVVNVAMTAINSHAILPIARDCTGQKGDLWILYLGNNEMVGPFGAATVFGAQAPPCRLVRLDLAVQKWRVGQVLAQAARWLRGRDSNPASWSGMQAFSENLVAPDDPRKQVVYRNFEKNLRDILQAGLDSGAHILLSTVLVNLKDCPPFGSLISSNLSAGDRDRITQLLSEGNTLAEQGNGSEALKRFEQAARYEPQAAELEFRWGLCLLETTNVASAGTHFLNALDLDCLPFRADTHINALISAVGRKMACPRLAIFDAGVALGVAPVEFVPGQEIFYEHVHLNFNGNYRLARAWADMIAPALPQQLSTGSAAAWASQEMCEERLGLTEWDRRNVLAEVSRRMQQPPLSQQFDNARRRRALSEQEAALRQRMDADAARKARQTYLDALRMAPDDCYLRENFAYFLAEQGDIAGAIKQWEGVRDLIPQDHTAYFELGHLAALQGRFDEAKALLKKTVSMRPSFAPGWFELGKAQAATGNYQLAVAAFDRALKFENQNAQCWFYSGLALAMLNRRAEAISHYHQAVNLAPEDWKAHYELGGLLGQDGKMAEAKAESEAAVRLNPKFPKAHLNLGLALVQLGQLDEAERQFEETLSLEPTNSKAADYLAQTRALKRGTP